MIETLVNRSVSRSYSRTRFIITAMWLPLKSCVFVWSYWIVKIQRSCRIGLITWLTRGYWMTMVNHQNLPMRQKNITVPPFLLESRARIFLHLPLIKCLRLLFFGGRGAFSFRLDDDWQQRRYIISRSSVCVQKLGYDCKRSRLLNTPVSESQVGGKPNSGRVEWATVFLIGLS
jgi:hypothetical protein